MEVPGTLWVASVGALWLQLSTWAGIFCLWMLRWTLHKKMDQDPSNSGVLVRILVKELERVSATPQGCLRAGLAPLCQGLGLNSASNRIWHPHLSFKVILYIINCAFQSISPPCFIFTLFQRHC
uniref:Uncharacterized protein n=1 Tax=Malurus cyaneus samueli TaxID=2593467 RepID=A0A8C5X8J1_9PASS